ncbi:hypothetical protein A9762_11975 [Pandoraea sp. ISTKB]|nr:hypothetical protein A9762_11975 [Pandoraea sp. ISTKB]
MPGPLEVRLSYVSTSQELSWRRTPLLARAVEIHRIEGLPEWKLPQTAKALRRIFETLIWQGASPRNALFRLDSEIQLLIPEYKIP